MVALNARYYKLINLMQKKILQNLKSELILNQEYSLSPHVKRFPQLRIISVIG